MRSRIPQIQQRAKEIIAELRKNKDVLDLVLDEFAPLQDEADAPVKAAPPLKGDAERLTKLYGELVSRCFRHAHVDGQPQYAVMMRDVDEAFKGVISPSAPVGTATTCKFDLGNGEFCGAVENDAVHGQEGYQHRFRSRKARASKLPVSVTQRIADDVKVVKKGIQPGECVQCERPSDDNVHHLSTTPGFHEFKEAA